MNLLNSIKFVVVLLVLFVHSSKQKNHLPFKTSSKHDLSFQKSSRSFGVDFERDTYVKDGEPIQLMTATIHYYRVPPSEWEDRMLKAKMGGMNTIQTYIEWASHEYQDREYDFKTLNITHYCLIAQKLDLNVILRLGPFIASERDGMGFPYWLAAKNPKMAVRTSDESYKFYVKRWYDVLLPIIVPLTYESGGPVIMAAVENEFGSYVPQEKNPYVDYQIWLRDLFRSYFGPNFLLITVDGCRDYMLKHGHIDQVYSTVDFAPYEDAVQCFELLRNVSPHGPLVNSEYYPGWFDCWGDEHQNSSDFSDESVTKTLIKMLKKNASVTVYPFHGGTSFGFTNGMYENEAMTTSYDFLAPVSELGKLTSKYWSIRHAIQEYFPNSSPYNSLNDSAVLEKLRSMSRSASNSGLPDGQVNIPLVASFYSSIFDVIKLLDPVVTTFPQTLEQLTVRHGFVFYETTVPFYAFHPVLLDCSAAQDRTHVFVNEVYQGTISQQDKVLNLTFNHINQGARLQLFVENQGHPCCGASPGHLEQKGIVGNVTLGETVLTNWTQYKVFSNWDAVINRQSVLNTSVEKIGSLVPSQPTETTTTATDCGCAKEDKLKEPAFYVAQFKLSKLPLNEVVLNVGSCGFKGIAFMNGFNLGRYWPVRGPQVTLYIPRATLSTTSLNTLVLFELDRDRRQCLSVNITDRHIIDGKVSNYV